MELAMDNMEKEAVTVRAERDDAIRKCAAVESRFSHMQQVQVALEAELEVERGRGAKLAEREREVKRNEERTSDELRSKTLMVEHLEKLLNTVRQEMQQQLQQTVCKAYFNYSDINISPIPNPNPNPNPNPYPNLNPNSNPNPNPNCNLTLTLILTLTQTGDML
jgi:hypothetical protein